MAIKIIQEYEIRCTDKSCGKILRYTKDDIKQGTISFCGRDGGSYVGISCPSCAQIIREKELDDNGREV